MAQTRDFTTKIPHLARSALYKEEKPFSCDFDNGNPDTASNHVFVHEDVTIKDMVDIKAFSLETNGFCIIKAGTAVPVDKALTDKRSIELAYAEEITALLHANFPEYSRIEMMNVVVRKRDPRYPTRETVPASHEQPAAVPHSDYSFGGLPTQIECTYPGQWQHLKDKDFDVLNLWRPLEGPNNDWPLALCDFASIKDHDIILNDDLHRDRAVENSLLHHNPDHQWYYIGNQTIEDILVFRTIDSSGKRARAFHCAVQNPLSSPSQLRTSIEIRVVALR